MLDFRFTNELNGKNFGATATLLMQPRLWIPGSDYPDYPEWREQALSEIAAERKRAMLAWWGREPVGSIIYQRHRKDPRQVEIKNISVEARARGRHIASFLLRQVECEALVDFPGSKAIISDTKHTNTEMLAFVVRNGYSLEPAVILESSFGHNGVGDVVFRKALGSQPD